VGQKLRVECGGKNHTFVLVSAAEIIAELPRMSVRERREIARRLWELETDSDILRTADETADQGFQILDQMESDGPAKAR
jgi:hypothetical protein